MIPESASPVFVGRAGETRLLAALVAEVAAGRGGLAWVDGEPGIGKSSLLAAGLAAADGAGCRVLWGVAEELAEGFPLRVAVELLEGGPDVERFMRTPWPDRAEDPVLALAERLLAGIELHCAASPVILVVDDLQWADDASLALLARVARLVEQLPLLLVVASRPVPVRPEVQRLRRVLASLGVAVLSLGPLPPPEVDDLVAALNGAPAGPRLRELAGRAGGNPLCVHELVASLRREHRIAASGGQAELVGEVRAPASMSAVIAERLGFLSDQARNLLSMGALLGLEFTVLDLAAVLGQPVADLVGVLDESGAAGVLVTSGERLAFRHRLLWQAFYDTFPASLRTGLHRHAAEALMNAGASVERVAGQLLLGAPENMDAAMVAWLAGVGVELGLHAPRIAAELLRHALARTWSADAPRERLEGVLVSVLRHLARHEEVVRLATPVLARTGDCGHAARMAWSLGRSLQALGRMDEALDVVSDALDRLEDSPSWRARLRGVRAEIMIVCGRPEGVEEAERAVAEADETGDSYAAAYALHALCMANHPVGSQHSGLAVTRRALTLASDDPEFTEVRLMLLRERVRALYGLDRVSESYRLMMETLELAERTASPLFVPLLSTLTTMHYFAGRWDEAVTDLDVVLEDLDELHDRVVLMVRSHGLRALIAARRDEREIAAWHLEAIAGLPIEPGRLRANAVFATVARAVLAERDGRPSDALAKLSGSLDPDYGNDMRYVMLPTVARLAMSLGEHDTARAAAAASAEDAAADPTPPRLAAAEVCRGLADADPARLLSSGVADRIELRPVEAAEALENAAVLLAQSGEVARAREVAEKALGVYAAVGAAWDVVRCESRIRAWGIRRGKRGVRVGRAASGWGALTPMELRVAALVAEGRSNPEIAAELFLSRRTVQTHVSHILAKLGARSRVEIAAEAAKNP